MDRLRMNRGLVALSGLVLTLAASGCRDRNLQVPPPAHYTEGAAPEAGAYPPGPMTPTDPATIDPYGGASYGATSGYDPAASPASGSYAPAASYGAGAAAPGAAGSSYGDDPSASYGTGPAASAAPVAYDAGAYGGTLASPSSPTSMGGDSYGTGAASDPATGMGMTASAPAGADNGAPAALPGLDDGMGAPPIPDALPMMP